jgi:hypothetical protein
MRKRTLGVVLLAGLAMSGAGAFTASNAGVSTNGAQALGYGEAVVTGAVVTDVAYNVNTTDASRLTSVVFTSSDNLTGKSAKLALRLGAAADTQSTCTITYTASATGILGTLGIADGEDYSTITCPTTAKIESFDTVGLLVTGA